MKKGILLPILALLLAVAVVLGANYGLSFIGRANAEKVHIAMLETLLPGGKDFVKRGYDGEDANIRSLHQCALGFVIETATQGYAGEIVVLVGVNNAGKVTGLAVEEAHETMGLGNRILTDHVFLSHFLNQSGSFTIGTSGADAFSGATGETAAAGEEITVDGISGATVSSKAVARCVSSAVAYVTGADASSGATSWGG